MLSISGIALNCTVTFYIDIRFEGFQLHLTPLKEVGWHFRIFQELRDIKKEENILKHDGKSPFGVIFLEDVNLQFLKACFREKSANHFSLQH